MNPIYKVPWLRPALISDVGTTVYVSSLVFKLEHDGTTFQPVENWDENRYRYRCMDCYLACGSEENSFTTEFERQKDLKDGPTNSQQDEMNDHARQHGIMWAWAKGLR